MLNIESIQEKFLFFYKFLRSPGRIGSVTPSSRFLATTMVDAIPWDEVTSAAELGAGTGAITSYIQLAKKEDTKVLLFEADPLMRERLADKYPEFASYPDCRDIQEAVHKEKLGQLDCILSGLPFFNFTQDLREEILEQVVTSLKDDGWFVAFQYSQQMRRRLEELFYIEEIKFVPMNVPPAFVYICRKKG
ncbi:Methyltransferase domain protein [compost metagenome]